MPELKRNFSLFDGAGNPSYSTIDELNALGDRTADAEFMLTYWDRVNDIILGGGAIRAKGQQYLPKLLHETQSDYDFRLQTSKFTNVYRDIVEGLAARPFEQPITLAADTLPEIMDFVDDVDGAGNNLTVFAHDVFFNGVNSGVDWIFVDYTNTAEIGAEPTLAEEKALGVRPFFSRIAAANVLEVRFEVIAGAEKITLMRIVEQKNGSNFVRVFFDNGSGNVFWELYQEIEQKTKQDAKYMFVSSGPITIDVIPMVPFVTGRRVGRAYKYHMPLSDAAELQIELYQQESGLKNLKTVGAFGILAGQGVNPATDKNGDPVTATVGPKSVLYAPPVTKGTSVVTGRWEWIVPDASIFNFLGGDVKDTINQLRELGKQPLTAQSGNVTVISSTVAARKGNSAVQIWAFALKNALENALLLVAKWKNLNDYEPNVDVFTDFGATDSATEASMTLLEMRKNGDLSQETLWEENKRIGVLSDDFDADAEREKLLKEFPGDEI